MLKVALLTTDTTHHRYFAAALAESCHLVGVVIEQYAPTFSFETAHAFEQTRETYEHARWSVVDFQCPRLVVQRANDPEVLPFLTKTGADIVIDFGTGKIAAPLIAAYPGRLWNLHGGCPEEYRGLDTHLWSLYHRDTSGLITTLHHLAADLDTGDIIGQQALPWSECDGLHALRAVNTEACVMLCQKALAAYSHGSLTARAQQARGRYYSAMPSVLKAVCLKTFDRLLERAHATA